MIADTTGPGTKRTTLVTPASLNFTIDVLACSVACCVLLGSKPKRAAIFGPPALVSWGWKLA